MLPFPTVQAAFSSGLYTYLVVGAGGGAGFSNGGSTTGGAGGGGEVKSDQGFAAIGQAVSVTVGQGVGTPFAVGADGIDGGASSIAGVATGAGGHGGKGALGAGLGGNGGASGNGNSGSAYSGANGGYGGGAGAAAAPGGFFGGAGVVSSITGSAVEYGHGGDSNGTTVAGWGGPISSVGNPGRNGIVVFAYPVGTMTATGGDTVATVGGFIVHTFTTSGTFMRTS